MTQRTFRVSSILALAVMGIAASSFPADASVPPPPVNQFVGQKDGVFNNLTEVDCRACHDNPGTFPGIMPNVIVEARHHALSGPAPVGHGDPCDLCHTLLIDPVTSTVTPIVVTNCLQCHAQITGQASVHHLTARAQSGDCKSCHGTKIVSNQGDGHYIPAYTPSMVTPYLSGGTGPITNDRGKKSGACDFCHDSGIDTSTGMPTTVDTSEATHHGTGFGPPAQGPGSPFCAWCHPAGDPASLPANARIRACENCHGPETLHNIQVSSVNPQSPVSPGNEAPYFGHIGNDIDCKGCHGPQSSSAYAPAPYSGPTAVTIDDISANVVPAGQDASITISGSGFVNLINAGGMSITVSSKVQLTSATGETTLLAPSSMDAATLVVAIPAATPVGAYTLNVVKVNSLNQVLGMSGPQPLVVVGPVTITSAKASQGVLTVMGSGFGARPTFDGQPIDAVRVKGVPCKVSSWADTQIVAGCAVANGDPVVVTTLLNRASAMATVDAANQPPVAIARASEARASTRKSITFWGTKSYDPDGTIVRWAWDFGNNTTRIGSQVTYAYPKAGTYTVRLTVTDNKGATGTATIRIVITEK